VLQHLRERLAPLSAAELAARFDRVGLPYAPITRPQALFDDPHLLATGRWLLAALLMLPLVAAGLCFILPSTLLVLGIAALYARYGALPLTFVPADAENVTATLGAQYLRAGLLAAGILLALNAAAAEPQVSLTVYSSAQPGGIPVEWYRPLPGMGTPQASARLHRSSLTELGAAWLVLVVSAVLVATPMPGE